ncbi:Anti-sigma regulatory factor (Ser/Thr protein kinase) [Lentzea fradiae]|uniref:Anti-sigma regulatory factor (Ser/Thr protein kinase) n=1 Tax=Lentzea fradiae TaxID=200378 RepID=A0A1G7UAP7_9PSEU|nr:Anti-sigma regulatory factor (Ser/Thr protein kinase) [Lentzea fradiae]
MHEDFLDLRFPADAHEVAPVRSRLREWLEKSGVGEDEASDLVLAVSEAVNNSVEHAYPGPERGTVEVRACFEHDGSVLVDVTDHGRWRVPPPALTMRGRGLLLMRESVDSVEIDRSANGTTVHLRRAPAPAVPASRSPLECDVRVHETSSGVVAVVRGNVPADAGPALRRALTTAARGGTVPLTVDLTATGEETSGLDRALHDVAEALRAAGNRLVVRW